MPSPKEYVLRHAKYFIDNHKEAVELIKTLYQGDTHSINDIALLVKKKYKIPMRADYISPMMSLLGVGLRTHKQVKGMMSNKLKNHGWLV